MNVFANIVCSGKDFALNLIGGAAELTDCLAHGARKRGNAFCAEQQQVNQKNEYDFRHSHDANLRHSVRLIVDVLTIFPPCQHLPLVRLAPRHTAIPMVRE
jgi:hypothetical protein